MWTPNVFVFAVVGAAGNTLAALHVHREHREEGEKRQGQGQRLQGLQGLEGEEAREEGGYVRGDLHRNTTLAFVRNKPLRNSCCCY